MADFFVVGCIGLMVVVVGMGSLWWRWLWFLVEFGVYRSNLGGLDQIGWRLGS